MKKFLASAVMLLFAVPVFAQDAAAPASSSMPAAVQAPIAKKAKKAAAPAVGVDEKGIQDAFDGLSQAWAAGDAKAGSQYFTSDATLINPFGVSGNGRAGVEKVMAADLAMMKGSQQTFSDFSFVSVMSNMALVDCTGTVTGMKNADGTDADAKKFHIYAVVVNRSGKWQARAIRPYAFVPMPSMAAASDDAAPTAASDKKAPDDGAGKKTDDTAK